MESIIARALEYTLKYWLKSFSRDQFKLQGMTVQLSNLDINGDALHASMGLPPAINVTTAKVGKLVIMLPSLSYVQVEPIVVQIDRLDLVLEENSDEDAGKTPSSAQSSTSSGKGSGYGFADKIADGMTVEVGTVNLLLETRGGAQSQGGATWASPLASITIRNLLLYTTNEQWQVVNLKEARDFSIDKKFIYLFKKLEWESLSIDLLPHPDMFMASWSEEGSQKRDDDGAKRVFFGGERFIEGISGQAYITVQRTELNSPLGLEVQLHISEVVCPALSEPGLRALLRFMTGFYVCLNRGDVDPKAQQRSTEAAGRSLVSIVVDHIFVCIKDAEFRLELLMQSLFFSRASVSDGEKTSNFTRIMISGLFLRDPFSSPPCTLVQPSMQAVSKDPLQIPDFGKNFCPPIYPLGEQQWQLHECMPLLSLHSLQVKPSPAPPSFASQTVISCQPLMIYLQEESCLRISSFLADGIVVNPGAAVLSDISVNSLVVTLKELDVSVPLDKGKLDNPAGKSDVNFPCSFSGARLHLENLLFSESPALKPKLLNLEKDPACFCLWKGQPIDASQNKWVIGASNLSLSLETGNGPIGHQSSHVQSSCSWRCVELKNACIEVAMATADGSPLMEVPPPGGIVRVGVSCEQYVSNTSIEQLFFVLDLYSYFGQVAEKIAAVGKKNRPKISRTESLGGKLIEKVPSDSAVSLGVEDLQLRFLEPSSTNIQGMTLVQFVGEALTVKVSHRTLGGAIAVSSTVRWESVEVACVETEENMDLENGTAATPLEKGIAENGHPQLRAVFWINKKMTRQPNGNFLTVPFLDINMVQMIPYRALDRECHSLSVSACIAGVRLGGGMNYAEALLHRFGILGPDGGPGEGLSKGLEHLAAGPLSKLLKASPLAVDESEENGKSEDAHDSGFSRLGKPDDVDISIEMKDWLFALEGAREMSESVFLNSHEGIRREDRCWHTTFQSLRFKAQTCPQQVENDNAKVHGMQREPVESIIVSVEGLQALKPQPSPNIIQSKSDTPKRGIRETVDLFGGINAEVGMVIANDEFDVEAAKWVVENLKFSVKQPVEAVVTKDELQHLVLLCKSEVDSMGRIAAGILRVLKLEESIGQAAIDQLSNLGSEGFDKIFTPENLSRGNSFGSLGLVPSSNNINESLNPNILSTVTSLEEAVLDSQAKCAVLMSELSNSEPSLQHIATIEQLTQKLENMQNLLTQLRIQL